MWCVFLCVVDGDEMLRRRLEGYNCRSCELRLMRCMVVSIGVVLRPNEFELQCEGCSKVREKKVVVYGIYLRWLMV